MSTTPTLLRIGQLADRTGKTVRALHFYEELGLVVPAERTAGGFRLYDEGARIRIHWIDRLQELGFSLPEIRAFLSNLHGEDNGPAAMQQLRAFYAEKLDETRAAIRRLQALESEINESIHYLDGCRACAPATTRAACRSCDEHAHHGQPAPALVAAVQDPT